MNDDNSHSKNGDTFHSELLAIYNNACHEIERTKQRQWRDFYNVLIAISAVTGFYSAVCGKLKDQWMDHLFFIAPTALMILGIWLVWKSQESLKQTRALSDDCYPKFDQTIQVIVKKSSGEPLNRNLYPCLYTAVIAITAVFGTVVMVIIRCSQGC